MASNQNQTSKSRYSKMTDQTTAELEWIRFREETLGPAAYQEAAGSKMLRKMKENPFVPIGAFSTLGALAYGLWCFRQGRARDSQMMMRARIAAQGFTVVALLAGAVLPRNTDSIVVVKTEPPPENVAGS